MSGGVDPEVLARLDKRAGEIERHVANVPGYYPEAIQHAADLRLVLTELKERAEP